MPIRAICFDLDNTLWSIDPVIKQAEKALFDWLRQHYPKIPKQFSVNELAKRRQRLLEEQPELLNNLGLLRKMGLAQAAVEAGYKAEIAEPAFEIFQQARHQVTFYPDVLPVLKRLQKRYILGTLTNGSADINRVGLGDIMSFSLMASDVNAAKPHPALFEAACQRASARPEEVVHVGDDEDCDVAGALAVGMKAVWLNRIYKTPSGKYQPHAIITNLGELERLLQTWESTL
ncbi:haloacid dehalogenase superfamily enzyme, subfamily IA [Beggiatoa alba B18LD]|uniref:Haloacid dehalogenase superfamily enzyme, subfamily IA n=1 Tax=Beggiatoa alba B18LD TaxID=395493 RepID=I3CGE9_9GAMM|nr:HAD-IA family hydrolase [Beggiatoa alba]EIJ42692.1 haloacid dehalogenase superfamily enzyme, subfamily IA [Beggiatoa alba B18LD]